jgi:hypothetical protein
MKIQSLQLNSVNLSKTSQKQVSKSFCAPAKNENQEVAFTGYKGKLLEKFREFGDLLVARVPKVKHVPTTQSRTGKDFFGHKRLSRSEFNPASRRAIQHWR